MKHTLYFKTKVFYTPQSFDLTSKYCCPGVTPTPGGDDDGGNMSVGSIVLIV